ncbi:hypothetical protein K435DRAFT_792685 [Dendrothele bispora CBS 962.96]|uniref:Uncharacterized protein n=1 Tax=Dendrothele bispora (strain CBS 962.96) TaxID=1314807 RepID=A0A4S8MIW6_DENBC|nr:hypothetical protein K435DRAFT_792685 [Dendrothele bispora CBS 962.96]
MTTITNVEPPPSLEDLPDELVDRIIELLHLDKGFPFLKVRRKYRIKRDRRPSYVGLMSLVNHRLRRLSLPMLFKNIRFELQLDARSHYAISEMDDMDLKREVQHLMKALECWDNVCMTVSLLLKVFGREISILYLNGDGKRPHYSSADYCKDLETSLIIDVLSRCTNLEYLELPRHIVFGAMDNQHLVIKALNRHPSDKLRLKFQYLKERSSVLPAGFQSMSLSRVVCCSWGGQCPGEEMKTWLAQGLNIETILRGGYDAQPDDSWMNYTYPGLTSIESWKGNHRSLQSTVEFFQRHPLVKRIELAPGHEHDNTPWGVAFAKRMHPYSCKVFHPDYSMVMFKVDDEWLYEGIMVTFQDGIPHGDVGMVETMVQKLGTMLSSSCDAMMFVVIDFSSPVGEYMTSEDLIGILTRNLSHAEYLTIHLGRFLCDILTRECPQILEPGSAINDESIAGFEPFRERAPIGSDDPATIHRLMLGFGWRMGPFDLSIRRISIRQSEDERRMEWGVGIICVYGAESTSDYSYARSNIFSNIKKFRITDGTKREQKKESRKGLCPASAEYYPIRRIIRQSVGYHPPIRIGLKMTTIRADAIRIRPHPIR